MYTDIDLKLEAWTINHGFTLLKEFGSIPRRYFYISAGNHECFQISIEPPVSGKITLNLWSVETIDNEELHCEWITDCKGILEILELAMKRVDDWKSRGKTSPK